MIENLHTVSRVFSDRLFRIPDYQRGYAWSRIQWDDLLQDLELLPDGKEHFAGTLILGPGCNVVFPGSGSPAGSGIFA